MSEQPLGNSEEITEEELDEWGGKTISDEMLAQAEKRYEEAKQRRHWPYVEFVAIARRAIPALIAEVRSLRGENKGLEAEVNSYRERHGPLP